MTLNCNINICLHSKQAQGKLFIQVLYAIGCLQLTIGVRFYNLFAYFVVSHMKQQLFSFMTARLSIWRIGQRIGYLMYYISSSTVVSHHEFPRCIEYKLHSPRGNVFAALPSQSKKNYRDLARPITAP